MTKQMKINGTVTIIETNIAVLDKNNNVVETWNTMDFAKACYPKSEGFTHMYYAREINNKDKFFFGVSRKKALEALVANF